MKGPNAVTRLSPHASIFADVLASDTNIPAENPSPKTHKINVSTVFETTDTSLSTEHYLLITNSYLLRESATRVRLEQTSWPAFCPLLLVISDVSVCNNYVIFLSEINVALNNF